MKIITLGGYNEVGMNMSALVSGEEAIIFDMGLYMPKIVSYEEELRGFGEKEMIAAGAIPDDSMLEKYRDKVIGIFLSHAHLDHIGAVPYLADKYKKAVIYGTPYTIEILKKIVRDKGFKIRNKFKTLNVNSKIRLSKNIEAEMVNITHSTLQCALVVIHTNEGSVVYANDFKLDNHPVVGQKPNYDKLRSLKNVKCLIVDSLYSGRDGKTPSERVAREMLDDVLLETYNKGKSVIVTTFSSHIARLKSIVDFGRKLNRKVIFVGRSLEKYVSAAEKLGLVRFPGVEIVKYGNKIKGKLKMLQKNRKDKYLIVCTGNQAEPGSVLDRMVNGMFRFKSGDHVIFSCKTIPDPVNLRNREKMESKLKSKKVRIFKDIHVSVLPDTEVVINDSKSMKIKQIKDIKNNEELRVPAFDSKDLKIKWCKANLVKHDYNGKIFQIKTKSGRSASITSGHSVFVLRDGNILTIPGDNLQVGDYLAIPKRVRWDKTLAKIDILNYIDKNNSKWRGLSYDDNWIYYNKKKLSPRVIKLDKNFGKLLGYYLAEGSAPRHISLTFGSHEKELVKECCKCIKKIFPSNVHFVKRGSAMEIYFGARILKWVFKKWFGNKAIEKKIPDFVFSANNKFKLAFLGAYINGDGCMEENSNQTKRKHLRIRIKTASKKLASDLLYLFSQVDVFAKFDHKEIIPGRIIAGNKMKSKESVCYVIRIQDKSSIMTFRNSLKRKFIDKINNHFKNKKSCVSTVPLALPLKHIDWNGLKLKKWSYLYDLKTYNKNRTEKHIGINLIERDSINLFGNMKKIVGGDLLFDPIVEKKEEFYKGNVYDFSVPGSENFIGGFGGIMLHNSGHCSREDLRDLVEMVKPKHIIPSHADNKTCKPMVDLAVELGYKRGKSVHLMQDRKILKI